MAVLEWKGYIAFTDGRTPNPGTYGDAVVKVTNPAQFRRDSETVEIETFPKFANNHPTDHFEAGEIGIRLAASQKHIAVMDGVSSRILDSQIYSTETNGVPHKLLIQVDLAPHETRTFYILDLSALPAVPPPIVKTSAPENPSRRFPAPRDPPLQVTIGN